MTVLISLVAFVVGLIAAFVYLLGETRRIARDAEAERDALRKAFDERLDAIALHEMQSGDALRNEFLMALARVEQELRTLGA